MEKLAFRQLPLTVKVAVGLVFNMSWWSIEKLVVEPLGLWKYMPYYRISGPCFWDLAVALISVFWLWRLSRSGAPTLRERKP